MNRTTISLTTVLAVLVIATGCASKKDVSPADIERQAFDDLRSEIRIVVDDPERQDTAIKIVDGLVVRLDELRTRMSFRNAETKALNADYDVSRDAFERHVAELNNEIRANRQQVGEQTKALFALTTPAERNALTEVRTSAMKAAIKSLQSI